MSSSNYTCRLQRRNGRANTWNSWGAARDFRLAHGDSATLGTGANSLAQRRLAKQRHLHCSQRSIDEIAIAAPAFAECIVIT